MFKRVLALLLCLVTVLCCFTACGGVGSNGKNDKGAYIRMLLTEPIYDFDPLAAFDNADNLKIVSMLFAGLFTADENGQPEKMLVDKYDYKADEKKGEYTLTMTLKSTQWSDGVTLTAGDAQYAFLRLFGSETSSNAIANFMDIKNARAVRAGDDSLDHLGVVIVDASTLEISFERDIDLDAFLVALCSPAVYPLRADIVEGKPNWAKKTSTLVCSGPFMLRRFDYTDEDGFILERNSYYMRNRQKDDLDEYVTPFRIVVNYATDLSEQIATIGSTDVGALRFASYIPLELRTDDSTKKADVTDAASTHVYYLNENAEINGEKLFAKAEVRKALSLAVDREALVAAITYAKAADGIVPYTVLNRADKKTEFRKKAAKEGYIAANADLDAAKQLLSEAGVTASKYAFSITVRKGDTEHKAMADLVATAWNELGFKVTVKELGITEILEDDGTGKMEKTGMYASDYAAALSDGDFDVLALDLVATSPDAFAYLAQFTKVFCGNATVLDAALNPDYALSCHITGYDSEAYNAKIEEAFKAEGKERAKLLHEAEELLIAEMPVIPMVYNQNATLTGKKISGVEANFYCPNYFAKTNISGYWDVALAEGFVEEDDGSEEEAAD